MIEENNLTPVGKIHKTHALKGELNAILDIDPGYFEDGNPMIVDVEGAYVPFYMETMRSKGTTSYLLKIKGIENMEEARPLVNSIIYAESHKLKDYMEEEGEELMTINDLQGYEVIDEEMGDLGTLSRIDDTTANILLVVEDEEGNEVYIPFASDFITDINHEERRIATTIPEALITLNKTKKDE